MQQFQNHYYYRRIRNGKAMLLTVKSSQANIIPPHCFDFMTKLKPIIENAPTHITAIAISIN